MQKKKLSTAQLKSILDKAAADTAQAEAHGKKFFYILRDIWGVLLGIALIASIGFQFWLTWAIGTNWLSFTGYESFLNIVAGENFIQVVSLCLIVVNFLFPKAK